MPKKSQIGMFIILGIVIFVAAGFLIYLNSSSKDTSLKPTEIVESSLIILPIKTYVESCIKNTAKDGLLSLGLQGGFHKVPTPFYDIIVVNVPYYFYETTTLNPSKNVIEQQIGAYVDDNINTCLNDFVELKEKGYTIESEKMSTKVFIVPNKVVFEGNLPLTINKDNLVYKMERFRVDIDNVTLDDIIKLTNQIEQKQAQIPDAICLSCLLNLSIKHDVRIIINKLDDSSVLFTILDGKTIIDNKPLFFNFAHKYRKISCSNLPLDDTLFVYVCAQQKLRNLTIELKIHNIKDQIAKVNIPFSYSVTADSKYVKFEDFTNLFDINAQSGLISFTPLESNIGSHIILIKAQDSKGNVGYESFALNITR